MKGVHTHDEETPLTLWFNESGEVSSQLGEETKYPLFISKFDKGYLWGVMKGGIHTDDAKRYPHSLSLDLKLRGQTMNGVTLALCIKTPEERMGYALSHWTELKKK